MYFSLMPNDWNYNAFDENLVLLDRLKNNSKHSRNWNILKAAFRWWTISPSWLFIMLAFTKRFAFHVNLKNDCLPYVFCSTVLPLTWVDLGPLQHLRWKTLWQQSTAGRHYHCQKGLHLIYIRIYMYTVKPVQKTTSIKQPFV